MFFYDPPPPPLPSPTTPSTSTVGNSRRRFCWRAKERNVASTCQDLLPCWAQSGPRCLWPFSLCRGLKNGPSISAPPLSISGAAWGHLCILSASGGLFVLTARVERCLPFPQSPAPWWQADHRERRGMGGGGGGGGGRVGRGGGWRGGRPDCALQSLTSPCSTPSSWSVWVGAYCSTSINQSRSFSPLT